jgi:hypothetical protein
MPGLKIRLKALETFRDGNIFPEVVVKGAVIEVDQNTAIRCQQSNPDAWEIIGKVIPPPVKPQPAPETPAPQVPGDGQEA